jgi:hypothetical protein
LVGTAGWDFGIAKLCSNGKPDASTTQCSASAFGSNGSVKIDIRSSSTDKGEDVVLQTVNPCGAGSADYIVVGGTANGDFALARLKLADGAPDTSCFGTNGTVKYDFDGAGGTEAGKSILLNTNNEPLIGGSTTSQFAGNLFGVNGAGEVPVCFGISDACKFKSNFGNTSLGYDMAFKPDNKVAVAGYYTDSTTGNPRRMAAILLCQDPNTNCNVPQPPPFQPPTDDSTLDAFCTSSIQPTRTVAFAQWPMEPLDTGPEPSITHKRKRSILAETALTRRFELDDTIFRAAFTAI